MDANDQPSPFTSFDDAGGLVLATLLPGSETDFTTDKHGWDRLARAEGGATLWVHLDLTRDRARDWLRKESGLMPLVADALLVDETRPRAQAIGDGLLVILRGINLNEGAEPDELISIRVWVEPGRVITLREQKFRTISALRERSEAGRAPLTGGAFVAAIAEGLGGRIGESVENLRDMLDDIEETMLDGDRDDERWRSQLATIRRQAIAYRRHMIPQREALNELAFDESGLLDDHDRAHLRVSMEHLARDCDALEEVRDRAAVTQEELRARHDARVGRTVYLLTLVATVALPLGLLTGLMGINVGGMPLVNSRAGFWVVVAVMVAIAGGQVWWFRAKRWI